MSELGWEPWCSELNFRTPYWKEVVAARLLLGLPTNGPGKAQVLGPLPLVGETGLEFLAPGFVVAFWSLNHLTEDLSLPLPFSVTLPFE